MDNIPSELIKYGGAQLAKAVTDLIKEIWRTEKIPNEWRTNIICPIHNKGDKLECKNYRKIPLLNTTYKVFRTILRNKLELLAENIIGEYQAGFRPGRSATDQLCAVKQVLEKCWEYDIDVYQLYVDFRKAYDSIDREKLYGIMLDFNISRKLLRLTRLTMENSKNRVKIQGNLIERREMDEMDSPQCFLI